MQDVLRNMEKLNGYDFTDQEIIQQVETIKRNDPNFDINYIEPGDRSEWTLLKGAVYYNCDELIEYLLTYPNINVNDIFCMF